MEAVPAAEAEKLDLQSLPTEQIEPGKHVSDLMQTVQDPKGFAIAFANGTGPRAQSDLQQHVRTAQSRPVIGLPRATRHPCATQWSGSTKRPYFSVYWLLTVLNLLVLIIGFVAVSFQKAFQKVVPRRTNADLRYFTSFCVPRRVNYDQQSQAVPFEQIIDFYMQDSDSDLLDYCMRQAGPTLEQCVQKRLAAQRVDQRLCNDIVCELSNERTADELNRCEKVSSQSVELRELSRFPKPDPMAIKPRWMEYVWTPIETALESELVEPPSQYKDSAIGSITTTSDPDVHKVCYQVPTNIEVPALHLALNDSVMADSWSARRGLKSPSN